MDDWVQVEQWLSVNAPASYSALRPPAQEESIAAIERALGFPACEAISLLLCNHDGTHSFDEMGDVATASYFLPGGHRLLSVDEIITVHQGLTQRLGTLGSESFGHWWHPLWLPFAARVSTDALFIDHREGDAYGRVGAFIHDDTSRIYWSSLEEFTRQMSAALTRGGRAHLFSPRVDGSALKWKVARQ
ncbi:SMI1/KNR4 family protein [Streptomyces sp. PT12]|uniref:SMI1/KNR4 family protein n=1 Tax=Streptomyces sp. PT12 TaxID=1510197 RepID=UPI0015EE88DA